MKRVLLVLAYYDNNEKMKLFTEYARPRFQQYADMHNLEYWEFNKSNYTPVMLHDYLPFKENFHYNNWIIIDQAVKDEKLKDGDLVYRYDCDVWIAKLNEFFIPEKSFTYAIDSGNTHCMGYYIVKIGPFIKKLLDNMLSIERHNILKNYNFFIENYNRKMPFPVLADQQTYYTCAGIKPHSWVPFYNLPDFGFHSYQTEYTIFNLEELLKNVNILPTEWNVTHLFEETGNGIQRDTYDIVHTTKDKVINRHFAGGQKWRFAEWREYCL